MGWLTRGMILGIALVTSAQSAKLEKDLAKHQAKYAGEKKPVGRAKELVKLGRVEVRAAQESVAAGRYDEALRLLQGYSEEARETHQALVKTGVNAERHSNGFRQLQISLRETARYVKQMASQVPFEERQPFETVLTKIEELNRELILELFPRQHNQEPPVGR